jgi:hypothetical protein
MIGMNKSRAVQWLYNELPALEQAAIISPETAARIRAYYGPVIVRSRQQLALLLLALLGAALVGLGIILLLAHNWDGLSRSARVVLSFAPLVTGQVLVGYTLLRRRDSLPWREGSGLFLALSIGAAIALISQTYHISGDISTFMLTWIILGAPLIYVLNATSVALLFIVGIVSWAGTLYANNNQSILFWFLAAFLAPHVWQAYDRHAPGPRMHLLSWGICLALPIAIGLVMERRMPGLWIMIYSGMFATQLIFGRLMFRDSKLNAFTLSGFVGIVIMGLILTYEDSWRQVGWQHYRSGSEHNTWGLVQDYLMVLIALAGTALPLVRSVSSRDRISVAAAALPILTLLGFAACSFGLEKVVMAVILNLYIMGFGGVVVWYGFSRERLLYINAGMAVLSLLIITRFFDAQISFTVRGVLFIIIGIAFLGINLYLSRRMKESVS